jgi:hypothetical protein
VALVFGTGGRICQQKRKIDFILLSIREVFDPGVKNDGARGNPLKIRLKAVTLVKHGELVGTRT